MNYDSNVIHHAGPHGTADKVQIHKRARNASESVCCWLMTAPAYHPFWSQYLLHVIRLRDIPGMPPPVLKFEGATHELLVVALNPDTQWTAESIHKAKNRTPFLRPINIAEQYEATNEEMLRLGDLCAQGVIQGILNPETADAPERIRGGWLSATVKTLAHIRGEAHAS